MLLDNQKSFQRREARQARIGASQPERRSARISAVLTVNDLPQLTDAATISRGRAYARTDHVSAVTISGDRIDAEVAGSQPYQVRLTAANGTCTCPSGGFCKHCCAVVIAVAEGGVAGESIEVSEVTDDAILEWFEQLDTTTKATLFREAIASIPELYSFLSGQYAKETSDLSSLRAEIKNAFQPRRDFYYGDEVDEYCADIVSLVELLEELSTAPNTDLLQLIEQAITFAVKTLEISEDPSGWLQQLIETLLSAHLSASNELVSALTAKEQRRLATWIFDFVFSGEQDFYSIDVDDYGNVLTETGIAHYAHLVDEFAAANDIGDEQIFSMDSYSHELSLVRHARQRLAIMTQYPAAILSAFGGIPTQQPLAANLVVAFDEAGLPGQAVQIATIGYELPRTQHHQRLVDRLVRDATERGDNEDAARLRREHFLAQPSVGSFNRWRTAAATAGGWGDEAQSEADAFLRETAPSIFLEVLIADKRDDDAWHLALDLPLQKSSYHWNTLLDRRQLTNPADVIEFRKNRVETLLEYAKKQNYYAAANEMQQLKFAADVMGTAAATEFAEFYRGILDANRRRPTCIEILRNTLG